MMDEPIDSGLASSLNVSSMRRAWETRIIQFWRRVFRQFPESPTDFLALREMLNREVRIEESHRSLDYLLNSILVPVFDQAMLAGAKERAELALSEATHSLMEFQVRTGHFPSRLDELGKEWIDPFDGKPLRYSVRGNGFRLYSINRDLEDNGGLKRTSSTPKETKADLVVEYP